MRKLGFVPRRPPVVVLAEAARANPAGLFAVAEEKAEEATSPEVEVENEPGMSICGPAPRALLQSACSWSQSLKTGSCDSGDILLVHRDPALTGDAGKQLPW